jgi:hypothetical protein
MPVLHTLIACLVLALGTIVYSTSVQAQNNVILFGRDRENILPYRVRNSRPQAAQNFFNFYVPLPNRAIAELRIVYPQPMASIFHPDRLEVRNRRTGQVYATSEVIRDEEVGSVRFVFQQTISAQLGQELEIISSGGTNPPAGMYRVRVHGLGTESAPVFISLGQWMVSIY